MNALLERFASLSALGKALVIGAVVVVVAALLIVFRGSVAVWVVLAGVLGVIFLVMAYQTVLSSLSRRRSSPFEKALAGASAMTPLGVAEPARRARLDDLRRVFESGVEKFRAAGKNLYALPWYLVVGEPGSGKTEAVRHCNVGFPPGMQDELQGAGGTLNMNWWFTNHAVMLDTAGRLMFEEVEPGTTGEWQEFLKLLRKFRPNCPINGLLLVIPAESLIKDSPEVIARKSSRIAKQFDQVQRTLGVRFPVFVVITKSDLINGFREFFDSVNDPQLQSQMLGWSNPASLDAPFDPEAIDQHLAVVQRRLMRRRLGLLLDPVNTENPKARRVDQVDSLFAFPESLVKIGPRLQQYLASIFVQGEWSAKPLFLRGIYFTSSMREGSALDAGLAEALGIPVDQLPEGRVWERDRAFFLRDLFMAKVFRERGLVTTAVNTTRLRRGRGAIIAAVGAAGLALLAGLTWIGSSSLKASVVRPAAFWNAAARAYASGSVPVDAALGPAKAGSDRHLLPIVQKLFPADEAYQYRGDAGDDAAGLAQLDGVPAESRRRAAFPAEVIRAAETTIRVPAIFSPVALLAGDRSGDLLRQEREQAARAIIRSSVVMPMIDAALTRMAVDSDEFAPDWNGEAAAALDEILRFQGWSSGKGTPLKSRPLLRYALSGTTAYQDERVQADEPLLDSASQWLLSGDDAADWGRSLLRPGATTIVTNAQREAEQWAKTNPAPSPAADPPTPPAPAPISMVDAGAAQKEPPPATSAAGALSRSTSTAIASAVANAARTRTAIRRPKAMPLARASAGTGAFDPRFHPEAAAVALAELAGPSGPLSPAICVYLDQYTHYWSAELLGALLPDDAMRWPELHAALLPLSTGGVGGAAAGGGSMWKFSGPLEAAADLSARAAQALLGGPMRDRLPPRIADRLEEIARAAEDGKRTGANASFERAMQAMLNQWSGLGADAVAAASTLSARLGPPGSEGEFFAAAVAPDESPDLAQEYWRQLSFRMADALRRDAAGERAQDYAAVKAALAAARFPLTVPTDDGVEIAADELGRVVGILDTAATLPAVANWTVARDGRVLSTRDAEANARIGAFIAKSPFTAIEINRLRAARSFAALLSTGGPLTCRLSIVALENPSPDNAPDLLPMLGGVRLLRDVVPPRTPGDAVPISPNGLTSIGDVAIPGPGWSIACLDKARTTEVARIDAPGTWSVLRLISQNLDRAGTTDGRVWDLPIAVDVADAEGQRANATLRVRLELDRPLPTPDGWPR